MNRRIFVDMDGTLAKWNNVKTEELYEKGYYENLVPNDRLLNNIKQLIKDGEDIYILSSYLNDSEYALAEKNSWLNRYLPEIPYDKRIFVHYGDNKKDYILNGITSFDYLIDDYAKNLIEWKEAGGTGIKYLNDINHTNGTWDGFLIKDDENLYENLSLIFNYPNHPDEKFNERFIELHQNFLSAIDEYRHSVDKPLEQFLNAEIKMKDAKEDFLNERKRLLDFFKIEEVSRWLDEGDMVIHYQVNFKDNTPLFDGYTFIDIPSERLTKDMIINDVLKTSFNDKIDITKVSPKVKSFVDDILSVDHEGSVRLYDEDLIDSWDMSKYELADTMKEIETELTNLGIRSTIDINYTSDGCVSYIDINPAIISEFDFTNEYHKPKQETKIFDYNINGKDVRCELQYNEKMGGYSVVGYTVDKENNSPEKIQQVLTKEELSQVQAKLLNEINNLFDSQSFDMDDLDRDIMDDMY